MLYVLTCWALCDALDAFGHAGNARCAAAALCASCDALHAYAFPLGSDHTHCVGVVKLWRGVVLPSVQSRLRPESVTKVCVWCCHSNLAAAMARVFCRQAFMVIVILLPAVYAIACCCMAALVHPRRCSNSSGMPQCMLQGRVAAELATAAVRRSPCMFALMYPTHHPAARPPSVLGVFFTLQSSRLCARACCKAHLLLLTCRCAL